MTGGAKAIAAIGTILTLVPCAMGVLAVAALDTVAESGPCAPTVVSITPRPRPDHDTDWDNVQVRNAETITRVGASLGMPRWGWVVALATAMQESGLRNLGHLGEANDHDSFGLFQQRPSQGWGTPERILDPEYAAAMFYRALLRVPNWQSLPLTVAAQRVQRSAYPDAYAKWQQPAQRLVESISSRLGLFVDCAAGTGRWVMPLPAGSYSLSSPFGPRWGGVHYGQDLVAPTGTPILAAAAGVVLDAGCTSPRCDIPGNLNVPGCGLRININHGGGIVTRYCHATTLAVAVGAHVAAGQVIGWVGSTGHSSGPHLHFEVHRPAPPATNANAVEPMQFLRGATARRACVMNSCASQKR